MPALTLGVLLVLLLPFVCLFVCLCRSYLTALSALWTMALLMGISGIPMSEVNTAKRYG